jgi:hypothetical protein
MDQLILLRKSDRRGRRDIDLHITLSETGCISVASEGLALKFLSGEDGSGSVGSDFSLQVSSM